MPAKKAKKAMKKETELVPTPVIEAVVEPTKTIKITLNKTRTSLSEGRSSGIGFGFLKKQEDGTFIGVNPVSPCKDYLNDVVYSETTGKPYCVYGLSTTKVGCFDDKAYLVVQSCTTTKSSSSGIDSEIKLMRENTANMQALMNKIEEGLKIEVKTKLVHVEDNMLYAEISNKWVTSTWAISLWSFILRNALWAKGGDPIKELEMAKGDDGGYMPNIIPKIKKFFETGLPVQKCMDSPHSDGIYNYSE